jgi:hypothetical protein
MNLEENSGIMTCDEVWVRKERDAETSLIFISPRFSMTFFGVRKD